MALDLNEYIKMSYERPNRKVLEGLGASEGLIEYLMETPGNTNWNVIGSITNPGGGGDAEVWFVGDTYTESHGRRSFSLLGDADHVLELIENTNNYKVYLNGEELPYVTNESSSAGEGRTFMDSEVLTATTKAVSIINANGELSATAVYMDASTASTSVEVSVKAK